MAGTDDSFNFLFNVLATLICAFAAWEVEERKARRGAQHA